MRRTRVLGFGLLLGSWTACGSDEVPTTDSDSPAPAPASELESPASKTSSLPAGAWVRLSQERLLSTPRLGAKLYVESEQPFRIAEVVAVEGEFVKLRPPAAKPEDLCGTTSGADPSFELHFFAELDALEPVLIAPKRVEFDDGSKLEFAVGVPIDLSGPEPSLQLGGANFVVPLEKHEIGWWFPAAPAWTSDAPGSRWSPSPLHYGERSVEPDGPPFLAFLAREPLDDDNVLLTFADACGRFTLRADKQASSSRSGLYAMKGPNHAIPKMARNFDPDLVARNAGILGVMTAPEGASDALECGPTWDAPAGVVVTWQDSGNIAGVTRTKVKLPKHAREGGGKVCFTAADMAVCIASDQLTHTDTPCDVAIATAHGILPDVPGGGDPVGPGYGSKPGGQVRQLQATVTFGLDPEIVRRIVRAHINELRSCYNDSRAKQPQLAGTITIEFELSMSGKVSSSKVKEASLTPANKALPKCFAKAAERWQFPPLKNTDWARVTYPFELLSQ